MGLQVRDGGQAAKRFATRAANAQPDYVNGVKGSGSRWEDATKTSEENYNAGVTQSMARGAFKKGVEKSGGAYFEARAVALGGSRYATGVQAGADNWEEGTAPYRTALASANLPARGPRGSAQNFERARTVAQLMSRVRTGSSA